ncbi:MAG: hypothetical protein IKN04_19440 [Clostridia bacterium]|nr:hypothetical protein [Clostridia bacterium]MBR6184931.1 hypothetical protein [Clostridia bacterium]
MKKVIALVLVLAMMISLCSFALAEDVAEIIAQAETMTLEELFLKAIEESNGKRFDAVGNSSRGKSVLPLFVEALQKIDPNYTLDYDGGWQQPKENKIFDQLTKDVEGSNHVMSMTLIQDGNQIQSKMLETGVLLNFVPKDWREAEGVAKENNEFPLALQTLNKVFMFNNLGEKTYKNMWDFVAEGEAPLFMGVNSELVGKNFLYMMTNDKYATWAKEAYELWAGKNEEYDALIEDMKLDAADLGLSGDNVQFGLAWVYLWCEKYNEQTDDGPICNTLVTTSAKDQAGLLVYSKLRSVEETPESSVNNITVAAYQDDYVGIGGYAYKHYLMLTKSSPLPWTSCALIAFMTTTQEGFKAWGKDMGGYAPVPACMQDHSKDGYVDGVDTYPAKNDRGYDWWLNEGKLVVEDPAYCASVSGTMSDWIDGIVAGK